MTSALKAAADEFLVRYGGDVFPNLFTSAKGTIVTDSDAPGDLVAALRARDIEVVVAAPAGADAAAGQR